MYRIKAVCVNMCGMCSYFVVETQGYPSPTAKHIHLQDSEPGDQTCKVKFKDKTDKELRTAYLLQVSQSNLFGFSV